MGTTKGATGTNKIADMVTQQVIEGLKLGKIPWQKPWSAVHPHNFASKHQYKGTNILLLGIACTNKGYEHPLFASYKQIQTIGGRIKKGERGHVVVFYKPLEVEKDVELADGTITKQLKTIPLLRYKTVFNISQTDLDLKAVSETIKEFTHKPDMNAEQLLHKQKPIIRHGGDRACYSPVTDTINMPTVKSFESQSEYYLTAYHELTHWTGHKSRCNRFDDGDHSFGSELYSKEELVAEIGGNMLSNYVGIKRAVTKNSQAYINGWLSKLKNDSRLIISASSKAQQATVYITGKQAQAVGGATK